jgi:hypothetical protein
MKAALHLQSESTALDICIPIPEALQRCKMDIHSLGYATLWEATLGSRTVQHYSTTPDPAAALRALAAALQH